MRRFLVQAALLTVCWRAVIASIYHRLSYYTHNLVLATLLGGILAILWACGEALETVSSDLCACGCCVCLHLLASRLREVQA